MINGYIPSFSPFGLGVLQPPHSNPPSSFAVDVPITKLTVTPIQPTTKPICIARKIRGKKWSNIFLDDCGYPNQSNKFDILLHNVKGGPILHKRKHPAPPLDGIDPCFEAHYDKATHGTRLRHELDLTHPNPPMWEDIYKLLQRYWSVFDSNGLFIPIKDYKCSIDMGSALPICVKKIHYGPWEIPIMHKCILSMAKLGHICQVHSSEWMFKALLAPKPHQEHVCHIDNFVWRFCVNYITLNQITCLMPTPSLTVTPRSTPPFVMAIGCGCGMPHRDTIKSG